eukprot:scaffold488599_cov23-Prasinocladus_malaysianus.AAC.1
MDWSSPTSELANCFKQLSLTFLPGWPIQSVPIITGSSPIGDKFQGLQAACNELPSCYFRQIAIQRYILNPRGHHEG